MHTLGKVISALSLLIFSAGAPVARAQIAVSIGANATVSGDGVNLTFSGDWRNDGRFHPGNGSVTFEGPFRQRILSEGKEGFHDLYVRKTNGELQVMDDIAVSGNLFLEWGQLDLAGRKLQLGGKAQIWDSDTPRIRGALSLITISRDLNDVRNENVGGLGLALTTRANLGAVTITRGHVAQRIGGTPGINKYFDVKTSRNAGREVDLVFHYSLSELNAIPDEDLSLFRSIDNGETWTLEGGRVDREAQTVTLTTEDLNGRWTLGDRRTSLPARIAAFTVSVEQGTARLTWTSLEEDRVEGYDVQVLSGDEYRTVEFVEARGHAVGQTYTYNVADLFPGRHRFRIRPRTVDGSAEGDVEAEATVTTSGVYSVSEPYPNPFNPNTSVTVTVASRQIVRVEVFDLQGRRVATLHEGPLSPNEPHQFHFDAHNLPSSIYLCRVTGETFIATRRMMLVK